MSFKKNISETMENLSKKTSMKNDVISERSRRSVLQGNRIYVWDREMPRKDQPYVGKNYHIPFNPPPNEVNFIGGLGKNCGHLRSKVHPNRTTLVQTIFNMRNQNRIDVSFTRPLSESNNCIWRKRNKTDPTTTFNINTLKNIVQRISVADIIETSSNKSGSSSDVSRNVLLARQMQKKNLQRLEHDDEDGDAAQTERYCIDGKPFYINRNEIKQKANAIISNVVGENVSTLDEVIANDRSQSFKQWAAEQQQRGKRVGKMHSCAAEKIKAELSSAHNSDRSSNPSMILTSNRERPTRSSRKNNLKHLYGYMYGTFSKPLVKEQPLPQKTDRFGIPFTMIARARKQHQKQQIQDNVLRRVRLSHMGYRQPPSKDDSSDDESVQNVKRLALLRTPYFLMPTIKISKIRRKERFRTKYLQKERLNRINLLLYDRSKKLPNEYDETGASKPEQIENVAAEFTKKQSFFAKFFQLSGKKKTAAAPTSNPIKEIYLSIIRGKYEEQKRQCEPDVKTKTALTFDAFKKRQAENHNAVTAPLELKAVDKQHTNRTIQNRSNDVCVDSALVSKLFRRKKHFKFRKMDAIEGPLYIDPHLPEKLDKPQKFKTHCKYYTNLFKSKFGLRNRLQVNDIPFEFGKIGIAKDRVHPTLPTEWDDYYVHEMRYRRSVKKFCVKTDILKLRDMVRKNFLMHYAQENLFDLKACQIAENRIMDEAEYFGKYCDTLFNGWAETAYSKVIEKNNALQMLQTANKLMANQRNSLLEEYDKLTKDILLIENQWESLLRIQNYYYLFMDIQWRQQNDWIHRNEQHALLTPLEAIKNCAQRNIRVKDVCSAEAVQLYFESENEPNLIRMKAIVPDSSLLKKSLEMLLKKSFVTLNQHNKITWLYKDIQRMREKLQQDMKRFQTLQQEKIAVLKKRQQFMTQRQQWLEINGEKLLNKPLTHAFHNPTEHKILGIIDVLYQQFVPKVKITEQLIPDTSEMKKFNFIHLHIMNLLQTLDTIPIDILAICERRIRKKRQMSIVHSKKAVLTQNRYETLSKQIKHQFTPTANFRRVCVVPRRKHSTNPKIVSQMHED